MPGIFIDVRVDASIARDPEIAKKLEEICPVSIFVAEKTGVRIAEENLDECVLCELCIEAAPPGAVVVKKLYDGTELRKQS
mgnify:CR=1 FL=1